MAELERELGLSHGLLKQWVSAAKRNGVEAFPGHGRLKGSGDEIDGIKQAICRVSALAHI
jgi:hypothetical protein